MVACLLACRFVLCVADWLCVCVVVWLLVRVCVRLFAVLGGLFVCLVICVAAGLFD